MKTLRWLVLGSVVSLNVSCYSASVGHDFLRYVYGADGVDAQTLCWPNDDIWMLRGVKNSAGLAQLEKEKISHGSNEVLWENIQNGLCILVVRDGKIDPAYMLDQVYLRHRQLILQFLYACLTQDKEALRRLTTDLKNVDFGGQKAAPNGDMDVYAEIIALLPVVRVSQPATDKVAQTVSYRLPLGKNGFTLTLVKRDSNWLVRTDTKTSVPLSFFYQ